MSLRNSRPRHALAALALLCAAALTGCAGNASSSSVAPTPPTPVPPAALKTAPPATPRPGETAVAINGPAVNIDNFNFTPATITVHVGDTVTWVNHDDVQHTVTASDNAYTSQPIDTDTSFTHTYTAAGTYSYFCAIHPFMAAKVVVQ